MTEVDGQRDAGESSAAPFDVERVRAEFPLLARPTRGRPLVYLDSAATTQKPRVVIDTVTRYYEETNANVHRGVYQLSEMATDAYEGARRRVARFLGAASAEEIVFTRGTTESINLVAACFAAARLAPGDEVIVSEMEHHSNIVPWQMACERSGARLVVAPMDDRGVLDLDAFRGLLGARTRLVAVGHVSNALGTINPVEEMTARAHEAGAAILVDGAQATAHIPVDVTSIGCDFYALSGHKAYGPTGVGALYARRPWLHELPPYQGGGEMIRSVRFDGTEYAEPPAKFEAGTPPIAGAIGMAAALSYITELDGAGLRTHEADVLQYAHDSLLKLPSIRLIGTAPAKTAVVSFTMEGAHPHDMATILDHEGIAIRAGHHCAQPVMEHFGVSATARASFGAYSTRADVDHLVAGLGIVREVLGLDGSP